MPDHPTTIIESLELELLRPEVRRSLTRLNELLDDEFFEFGASGSRYTKQEILQHLTDSASKYSLRDLRVLEISSDIMLATYLVEKETPANRSRTISLRSSLWRNRNGRWRIVFHQGTPLPEPPVAERST